MTGPTQARPTVTPSRTRPPAARRATAVAKLVATLQAIGVAMWVAWRTGDVLPAPKTASDAPRWLVDAAESDPIGLVMAGGRLLALGLGAHVLATTLLATASRVGPRRHRSRHNRFDRWTLPPMRRLIDAAMGTGVALTISLSVGGPAFADAAPPPSVAATAPVVTPPQLPVLRRAAMPIERTNDLPMLRRSDREPTTTTPPPTAFPTTITSQAPSPSQAPSTSRSTSPAAAATTTTMTAAADSATEANPASDPVEAPDAPAAVPAAPAPTVGVAPAATITVRPGDSFWRIAAADVSGTLGRAATDHEIAPRWRAFVAANRDRLERRDDPDLLFAGQTLVVPPATAG